MNGFIPGGIQRAALRYGPMGPDLLYPTVSVHVSAIVKLWLTRTYDAFRQPCLLLSILEEGCGGD
jgi:hypothetical protein